MSLNAKNSRSSSSSVNSVFNLEDANNINNKDEDIDEIPIAYRTAAEILNELNIDKCTVEDQYGSFIEQIYEGVECERTLAIIKPNAMQFREEIEKRIEDEGFVIITRRKVHLSPEQASEFYSAFYGTLGFPTRIVYMSSAPIMAYVLAHEKAIPHWLKVIGPENVPEAELFWPSSLRGIFGKYDNVDNALHGSANPKAAKREIRFFFPNGIMEPFPSGEIAEDYLNRKINPTLSEGLAELLRVKPIDPVIWLAEWLLWHNPNRPKLLPEVVARTKT